MDRSYLHGGPIRGNAGPVRNPENVRPPQDARVFQDARSNLAVKPATNPGNLKLKKTAVKIVTPAGPEPGSPAALHKKGGAVISTPLENLRTEVKMDESTPLHQLAAKLIPPSLPPSGVDLATEKVDVGSSLDEMFARLAAKTPSVSSLSTKAVSPLGPDKATFTFEDDVKSVPDKTKVPTSERAGSKAHQPLKPMLPLSEQLQDQHRRAESPKKSSVGSCDTVEQGESKNNPGEEYMRKATAYLKELPCKPGDSAHIIKTAAGKLRAAYETSPAESQTADIEKLRSRYVFAIISYVNQKVKLNREPLTADSVKKTLLANNGDFLQLFAALVEDKYIATDNLEHVTNLCQYVLNMLPKADVISTPGERRQSEDAQTGGFALNSHTDVPAKSPNEVTPQPTNAAADPLEGMKAWPTREKREHGATYRSCTLKGIGEVKSLHQLQALVWGGKLESINMPEVGSEHAAVKFLTPEACQAYLDATKNGIEIQNGAKKMIIFVNMQPEPNSINDVIQNCIDGDASRCIRATGADDDWSNRVLFKLARGKQQIPRTVDCIKQGKTARGHHYIEFRFGNIYHALNFKRYLMNDEDWEHCNIIYAPDPCMLASGVHDNDTDEWWEMV